MRERIPIDTLLYNLRMGNVSRVGYMVDIINAVNEMPVEEYEAGEDRKAPDMTYGEMVREVKNKPPKTRDVLVMSLANRLYGLSYQHRFRHRERNI